MRRLPGLINTDDGADEAFNKLLDDENQWPPAPYMAFPSSALHLFPCPPGPPRSVPGLSPDKLFSSVESWSPKHLCSPLPFPKRELSVHGQLNIPISACMRTVPNPVESACRPTVSLASWVASFV